MINRGKIVALDKPENLKASVTGSNVIELSFSGQVVETEHVSIKGVIEVHRIGDKLRLIVGDAEDIVGEISDFAKNRKLNIARGQQMTFQIERIIINLE